MPADMPYVHEYSVSVTPLEEKLKLIQEIYKKLKKHMELTGEESDFIYENRYLVPIECWRLYESYQADYICTYIW